jgi:transcriptional regulator with XRE-family HTH domain
MVFGPERPGECALNGWRIGDISMNTPAQIRASRALLGWDQLDLANAAGVDHSTIQRMERLGPEHCASATIVKVREALERAGILFLKSGLEGAGIQLTRSREFLDKLERIPSQFSEDFDQKSAANAQLENFIEETLRFYKGDVNEDQQVRAKLSQLQTTLEYEIKRRGRDRTAALCRDVCDMVFKIQTSAVIDGKPEAVLHSARAKLTSD